MVGRSIAKPTTDRESSEAKKDENEKLNNNTSKDLDSQYDNLPKPTGKNVIGRLFYLRA